MRQEIGQIFKKLKRWNGIFCERMTCKTNLKRDFAIIGTFILAASFLVFVVTSGFFFGDKKNKAVSEEASLLLTEQQIYEEVRGIQQVIDTTNWTTYQSRWYGIELKYPENFVAPKNQGAIRGGKWEYSYQFRKKELAENNPYSGFDVMIYNLSKVKEMALTDEFPLIKDVSLQSEGKCETIEGHLIETGDYPAEEVYIPPADDCYNPTLFFSFTKGEYIYNVVPRLKEGSVVAGDPRVEITDNFPEFLAVISTLKTVDIVRPKPAVARPRITAPKPYAATRRDSAGRTVCASKNDHPKKSSQGKGKHLDMECCLDPDEYPNPWCYYPPEKYGKYLK